jgi:hypothetical protein
MGMMWRPPKPAFLKFSRLCVIPFSVTALPGHHQYAQGLAVEKTAGSDDPAVAINLEVNNRRRKIILFIPRITYF